MAIVKTNPNGDKSTVDGMAKYSFSGSPTDQFEHIAEVNEMRTMTITVICRASGKETIEDGERTHVKWRVVNAELGKSVDKPAADPELDYDGEGGGEYGDYTDSDSNSDSNSNTDSDNDTPPAATEFDGGPSFSGKDN
ncbi:hypothetical protein GCM10007304_18110 [Rhodococcoides trifolii]|uniref:Uncharacterized protein n=1 Tax=Rhodococcoides trifolii TaxID=908250 RepID=A0A917D1N0_9NOCA|nr:hypothetical protein [Rhodococcus trifolii]GGG04375.1 hypothetical protein GCM10007304_18110 [Rhodococcus trifolii]